MAVVVYYYIRHGTTAHVPSRHSAYATVPDCTTAAVQAAADGPQTKDNDDGLMALERRCQLLETRRSCSCTTPVYHGYTRRCRVVRTQYKSFVIGIIPRRWYIIILLYCITVCTVIYNITYFIVASVCSRRKSRRENIVT